MGTYFSEVNVRGMKSINVFKSIHPKDKQTLQN